MKRKKFGPHLRVTTARFTWATIADLDAYAKQIGRERADIIRWAVREYLDRHAKKPESENSPA